MIASIIFLVLLAAFIGSGMMRRIDASTGARYVAIWGMIFIALFFGYRIYSRIASTPREVNGEHVLNVPFSNFANGYATMVRLNDGHDFHAIIDTGASAVVLPYKVAEKVGLNPAGLAFDQQVSTANGVTTNARTRLDSFCFGDQCYFDVPVSVSRQGALDDILIGTPLLDQFEQLRIIDGTLHITF